VKTPAFWSEPPGLLAWLLSPFGWLYGKVTAQRMRDVGIRAPVPVVCIGNLTAGGTGKTPVALWLAEELKRRGERPVFLTRGYGGSMQEPCVIVAEQQTAAMVGDEALLLAAVAPTIRSADRVSALPFLAELEGTVLIMDDGLQNPAIEKDLAIALIDGAVGFGNGFCVPAGPLRAPVAAQLPKVDLAIVMGDGAAGDRAAQSIRSAGKPVSKAWLAIVPASVAALRGQPVLAFAGIGRPSKFFDALVEAGVDVRARRAFDDHHAYTAEEISVLRNDATTSALRLVTTTKDRVKLPGKAGDITVVEAAFVPEGAMLMTAVEAAIARRRSAP
jgi:tetraacyldisaccharide 4'-kinase